MAIDLIGKKFNMLTVISQVPDVRIRKQRVWWCLCDCGNFKQQPTSQLTNLRVQSCGCIWEVAIKVNLEKSKYQNGEGTRNRLYSQYRSSAKRRGLSFELTREEFHNIATKNCTYCGTEPDHQMNNIKPNGKQITRGVYIYNGVDRIDSAIGYSLSNSVSSCLRCNYAKNDSSVLDFNNWIDQLVTFRLSKRG